MTRRFVKLAPALALALALASAGPARAEGRFALAGGLDYRSMDHYFYFYGYPSSGHSETSGSVFGLSVEGLWRFQVGERGRIGPGVALGLGTGSADFSASGAGTSSESVTSYHVEAFGEGGYAFTPGVTGLVRLGVGVTGFAMEPAGEGQTNLLGAVGIEVGLRDRLAVAVLYQGALANFSAWTDAGVTSADPSVESTSNSAFLLRGVYRF